MLLLSCQVQADEPTLGSDLSQNIIEQVYRPLHGSFAELSKKAAGQAVGLCQNRLASSGYQLQSEFTRLLEAYSAIELFRTGPLLENNRKNRLFYWPDNRRVGKRQLTALLESEGATALTVEQLARKSVALQGFTALERLLFTQSLHPLEEAPQCHLIPLIMQNIADMAGAMYRGWSVDSDYLRSLLQPYKGSEYFRTHNEVVRGVFTQAKVGLDNVIDAKLVLLLSNDQNKMAQSPMWLSQRAVAMLTGNVQGLRGLLLDSGLLANTRFQEELRYDFDYIDRVLAKLKPMVYLQDESGKLKREPRILLNQLAAVLTGIRYVVSSEVSKELGVSTGFNSDEGD